MAYLTREDLETCRRYPDGIARCNYGIDIHNPRGKGTERTRFAPTEFYEIPFGTVVPRDVDNLLIGSRCISGDVAAHSSFRIMPTVCSIGQAAGMAAAMAVEKDIAVPEVDGVEVRRNLNRLGAGLDR